MKRRLTRRRSALRWCALAVALILAWGVAKDFSFTPWQARRKMWKLTGLEGMEQVIALDRTENRYIKHYGGPDYIHWTLFANDERMGAAEESFSFEIGWHLSPYSWELFTPESACSLPECTLWTDRYYRFSDGGCIYFRADDIKGEVTGFSLAEAIEDPDGTVRYGLSDRLLDNVDLLDRTRISREELAYDSRGHAYGMFSYCLKEFDYDDELALKQWYLRVELADGGERVVPIDTNQVIRWGGDGTGSWWLW